MITQHSTYDVLSSIGTVAAAIFAGIALLYSYRIDRRVRRQSDFDRDVRVPLSEIRGKIEDFADELNDRADDAANVKVDIEIRQLQRDFAKLYRKTSRRLNDVAHATESQEWLDLESVEFDRAADVFSSLAQNPDAADREELLRNASKAVEWVGRELGRRINTGSVD